MYGRFVIPAILVLGLVAFAAAQSNEQEGPVPVQRIPVDKNSPKPKDNRKEPPRTDDLSPDESSSKQTETDISAPKGDEKHSVAPEDESDVNELHPYDPHKAAKCVEVGDYYFKQQNYRAAVSRYQEALEWKPRDAEATYKLAQGFEKTGDFNGALTNYEAYLKILPDGPYAAKAKEGITRVKPKADTATAASKPSPS